jgi:methylated-DNA-[protein]-cysteine S-methyltransferase
MTGLELRELASPIGTVLLVTSERGVVALDFADCRERMQSLLQGRYPDVELVPTDDRHAWADQVGAYLNGALDALDNIPVDTGGTPFQRSVWEALRSIPVGETRSYAAIAAGIGRPDAPRAVGSANGRNPVALIVPCHRVIAADGRLAGYAGGLERKRWLLAHESAPV